MATVTKVLPVTNEWSQITNGEGAISIRQKFLGGLQVFIGATEPDEDEDDIIRVDLQWTHIRDLDGSEVWVKSVTASNQVEMVIGAAPVVDVTPKMSAGGNTSVQTLGAGANWAALPDQACSQVAIVNDTGTKLEFRQGGGGVALPIFDQSSFPIFGISNANQIQVRRADSGNTQVTVKARWER